MAAIVVVVVDGDVNVRAEVVLKCRGAEDGVSRGVMCLEMWRMRFMKLSWAELKFGFKVWIGKCQWVTRVVLLELLK